MASKSLRREERKRLVAVGRDGDPETQAPEHQRERACVVVDVLDHERPVAVRLVGRRWGPFRIVGFGWQP